MNKALLLKILTIGLYIAPLSFFLFYQKTVYPMITLKFISFFIVIELLFLVWIALILWFPEFLPVGRQAARGKSLILVSLLVLLNILTITSMMGINPARSFWSTPDRLTGLFAMWHFFIYFLMLYSLRKELNWQKYFKVLFGVSLVVALFVLVQKVAPGIFLSGEASRPGSFIGNPALLAGYLIFNIFIGFWLASGSVGKARWFYAVGAAYEVFAIFLGSTRGAMIGLAVGAIAFLIYKTYESYKSYGSYKNAYAIILASIIIFSGLFFATRSADVWQSIPGLDRLAVISKNDSAISDRFITWGIAIKSFKTHPLLGNGFENFKYDFDSNYNPQLFRSGLSETFWDRPHNVFLEYLTNSGLLGLVAYLAVLISAFYVVLKKTSKEFRPFGIGLIVAYIVQNTVVFDSFGTYLMFFALLAYLASSENETEPVSLPASQGGFQKAGRAASLTLFSIVILSALYTNIKIVYANNLEYWGINYISQKILPEGIESFKKSLAINQPYVNDIRIKQLQMLTRADSTVEIPDRKMNVQFAFAELKKVITTDAFNYYLYYTEADSKVVFRDLTIQYFKDAQIAIKKADMLSPNRQQNLYVYAKVKFLFGDFLGSIDMMKRAVDLDELSADPHYYYALLLWNSKNTGGAIKEFRRAVELGYKPKDPTEAKQLGDIYGDAEEYDKALEFYKMAIAYDAKDVDAQMKTGLVYMFMGDSVSAKPYLVKVLELLPDFKSSPNYGKFKPYFESVGL